MKRGFTLVELLGIFSIMAAIFLLSIPAVTNMLKQAEESQFTSYKQDIYLAAEAYISKNRDDYLELREKNTLSYVRLKNLMASGYLKSTMINPITNKKITEESNNVVIIYQNDKGLYVYDYIQTVKEDEIAAMDAYDTLTAKTSTTQKNTIIAQINALSDSDLKTALLNKIGV